MFYLIWRLITKIVQQKRVLEVPFLSIVCKGTLWLNQTHTVRSQRSKVRWYKSYTKIWCLQIWDLNLSAAHLQRTLWKALGHRYVYFLLGLWTVLISQPSSCLYREHNSSQEKNEKYFSAYYVKHSSRRKQAFKNKPEIYTLN